MSLDSPSLHPQPCTVNWGYKDNDLLYNDKQSLTTSVTSDFNKLKEIYSQLFKGKS